MFAEDGTSPGKGEDFTDSGEDNYGLRLWNKLISKYKNIELVFCGHSSTNNVVLRRDEGDNGNLISTVLVDPQAFDKDNNYETGMVAMLYFSEDGEDVQVEYYSTFKDKYYKEENQFSFSTAEAVFETWDLTGTNEVSFEAPVSGKYTIKGLEGAEVSLNETALLDTELFDMAAGDTLKITADGSVEALLQLNDEYPDKTTITTTAEETIIIADALQVENTTAALPATEGLITSGYVSGIKKGSDMVAGAKKAVLKDGYTFYQGKYTEAGYGMSAFPTGYALMGYERQGTVKLESKNGSTQGVIITADKAGIYTLSSSTILKSGTGYVTVNVELPDGKIPYTLRTRHTHSTGFNITAELEAGEKMYVYVCRETENYSTSSLYFHDFTLKRTVLGEFEVMTRIMSINMKPIQPRAQNGKPKERAPAGFSEPRF